MVLAAQALAGAAAAQDQLETVVVTGSLIASDSTENISPVSVVGQDAIKQQGATRIEDLLNDLPQVSAGLSTSSKGGYLGNAGIATVNLRGLGSQRTLVLINGRRLMPGDPLTGQAADLNNIPAMLIDHVDVVTGGASATYGSDAVAGVVNFVMKKNLEGLHVDLQYGGYQNDNGNAAARGALARTGISAPSSNIIDGGTLDANAALGLNTDDGKGNVTIYAGYRKSAPVTSSSRDYSKCQLSSGTQFGCVLSGTTNPAQFDTLTPTGAISGFYSLDPATGNTVRTYNSARDGFNGQNTDLQRPATRVIAGAMGSYDLAPNVEFYTELMGMDNRSVFLLAPDGSFLNKYSIACNNPMLSAQEESTFCAGLPSTSSVTTEIGQRNVQGGPRLDDIRSTAYRAVGGVRGKFAEGWTYDLYAQSGTTLYDETLHNSVSNAKIKNALNVVVNPASGQLTCASVLDGSSPTCVPYNVFAIGGITKQATNYIAVPSEIRGDTSEQVINGTITGDLGQYGIASPYAPDKGVSLALGGQYRSEGLNLNPDEEWQTGDLAGEGVRPPVSGSFNVYEFYGEVSAPLARDLPFIKELTFDGGYRYSNYSSSGETSTYKFGGEWAPIDEIRFRASYQRAVRAPSIVELYAGQAEAPYTGTDPCDSAHPVDSLAQCARTGVTAAQYGNIPSLGGQQPTALTGGNPNLKPEISNTKSFGVTVMPQIVPGLTLSADYFNIGISQVIGTISPSVALTQCALTGNSLYCGLVHRAPGSGVLNVDTSGYVISTNVNAGNVGTSGVDFGGSYGFDMGSWSDQALGSMTLNFDGSLLSKYNVSPIPGLGSYDCEGSYGPTCGNPMPTWRHQVRSMWQTPWYDIALGLTWRHIGSTKVETSTSNVFLKGAVPGTDAAIGDYDYFDLMASMPLGENLQLRAGVQNLFDRDPPLIGSGNAAGQSNDNSFPGLYDVMGRYAFVSVSAAL